MSKWGIWSLLLNKEVMHVFLTSTGRAGIPRFPASWSQLWGGGSCLLFLSFTADVGAPNNVIQFPVFHFSGKPRSQHVWCSVCMWVWDRKVCGLEEKSRRKRRRRCIGPDALGAGRRVRGSSVNTLGALNESRRRPQTVQKGAGDDCRHLAAPMCSDWSEQGRKVQYHKAWGVLQVILLNHTSLVFFFIRFVRLSYSPDISNSRH